MLTGERIPDLDWRPDLTGPPLAPPAHILDLVLPRFVDRGADPAVTDAYGTLTYAELDARSAAVAQRLLAGGLRPSENDDSGSARLTPRGDPEPSPVAVHTRLSRWAVVAMLGALRAGARYLPIDAAFPVERQRRMAIEIGAELALVEPGICATDVHPEAVDVTTLAPGGAPLSGARAVDAPAYTYFTSGSTGRPKPVTISATALAYSTAARLAHYPEPVRGFLLCSSISFDSSVAGIYWTLASGGHLVIPSDRPTDVVALGRAAGRHDPSHLLLVPSLYQVLLRGRLAERLAGLSTIVVAGESCPPDLVRRHYQRLPGVRLYNEYGPTECTVWSTVHECVPADGDAPTVPIGRPIPGTRIYLRGPDGEPVPAGTPGALWIGGPGVAVGTPPAAGVYRTGDLASLGADGLLRFHGRVDDQLKLDGVRIAPAEIEDALLSFDAVAAAAVTTAAGRGRLVAFVVPAGPELDLKALRAHARDRLPAVAVPAAIEVVDALPVQPNGKLDRAALRRLAGG